MARYELVKQDIGKSPRLKVTLLDTDGSTIAEGYLIIYRRYCFQIVDENNDGDLGSTPVMNLHNLSNLPDNYQASILINIMARNTIYEFVKYVYFFCNSQRLFIKSFNNHHNLNGLKR